MFKKIDPYRWKIEKSGSMKVDGLIYASENMLPKIIQDRAAEQVKNVASLPGIVGYSYAMPDIHWGYGFPIGGVAAMNLDNGVISPGGIGYDISCGVRLIRTNFTKKDIEPRFNLLIDNLFQNVPSGVGRGGKLVLSKQEIKNVLVGGAKWAVEKGFGLKEDLESIEEYGVMPDANPDFVSNRAIQRGLDQLGTLGSGNHFLEIQVVEEIFDENLAKAFGLFLGQITILIHSGSRGLGYQVCDDFLQLMMQASQKYKIFLPDRQLCCAPINSPEGQRYFQAMASAVNYGRANRQLITHWIRETFQNVFGRPWQDIGINLVYDVSHNIGRIEEHSFADKKMKVFVHRKGATRSFPKGHPELSQKYKNIGQPVLIPGTMGTSSYVLVGTELSMKETFGTTCHGAGRTMSRTQATKQIQGDVLKKQLESRGILIRTPTLKGLAEEAPFAYKDVGEVVDVCHRAGISCKVARMKPLGVVKG